jgi:hypothetical protein
LDDSDPAEEDETCDEFDEQGTVRYAGERIGRNDPCPCGSGSKYKKCCGRRMAFTEETDTDHVSVLGTTSLGQGDRRFPIGTVAHYGPDDKTTTKIVVGIIKREGADPVLERWVGSKVTESPKVQRQMKEFLEKNQVKSVVLSEGNLGCPHEEGLDFPLGADCPFCPYWAGKQGSGSSSSY